MKLKALAVISSLAILLGSVSSPSFAATVQEIAKQIANLPPAQRKKAVEEGARKEGQIVFYTSISVQDNPQLIAAFEKTYPFVKTAVYRGTPTSISLKARTAPRAGNYHVALIG